jgi:hypothetical protein
MNKPVVFLRIAAVLTLIHSVSPALERYLPADPKDRLTRRTQTCSKIRRPMIADKSR